MAKWNLRLDTPPNHHVDNMTTFQMPRVRSYSALRRNVYLYLSLAIIFGGPPSKDYEVWKQFAGFQWSKFVLKERCNLPRVLFHHPEPGFWAYPQNNPTFEFLNDFEVKDTPPKTNICPKKKDDFSREYIFQPLIFRGQPLVFRGVSSFQGIHLTTYRFFGAIFLEGGGLK